jgi:hypothetical protein
MHYTDDAWSKVEDAEIIDGYVWGTLESFSPIAIFEYRKDIHEVAKVNGLKSATNIVCEGNPVSIKINDNNNPVVVNTVTGTSIEVTKANTYVVGGSVDGSYVGHTSISVDGMENNTAVSKIIVGSVYTDEGFIECGNINLYATNCAALSSFIGSFGAVRTQEANFKLSNIDKVAWFGCASFLLSLRLSTM